MGSASGTSCVHRIVYTRRRLRTAWGVCVILIAPLPAESPAEQTHLSADLLLKAPPQRADLRQSLSWAGRRASSRRGTPLPLPLPPPAFLSGRGEAAEALGKAQQAAWGWQLRLLAGLGGARFRAGGLGFNSDQPLRGSSLFLEHTAE